MSLDCAFMGLPVRQGSTRQMLLSSITFSMLKGMDGPDFDLGITTIIMALKPDSLCDKRQKQKNTWCSSQLIHNQEGRLDVPLELSRV